MPKDIYVEVVGPDAIIDFVDPALVAPGLRRLLDIGGPEMIEVITRDGPRRKYRVPEGNARQAGLIDGEAGDIEVTPPPAKPAPEQPEQPEPAAGASAKPAYPDGKPAPEWSRQQLDAYAAAHGIDTLDLPNKGAALTAIRKGVKS